MHPCTPDILAVLLATGDAMIRAQDDGSLRPCDVRREDLKILRGQLAEIVEKPDCGFDDSAVMLADCLIHLEAHAAPYGDSVLATKWAKLAKAFHAFVGTDWAVARAAVVPTSDHDFERGGR